MLHKLFAEADCIESRRPRSQIVCLTASISRSERDEILAAGAFACVMKDDDLDEIFAAIVDAAAHAAAS